MKNHEVTKGHILALVTMLIWGTTFISTKILLNTFSAIDILFFRFVIGTVILFIIYPKPLKVRSVKHEISFIFAGLSGICLYYLLENMALTYTNASNVGIIISIAPFFTAIFTCLFSKEEEKLSIRFFIGFAVALLGIYFINLNGSKLSLNPIGDFLAILAAIVWAIYSLLTRKISHYGYNIILTTRRTFLYGLIFMLPIVSTHINLNVYKSMNMQHLFHFLYLGIGASALCFVTWNWAVKTLGTIKSSVYIYTVPVITVFTSAIILKEEITLTVILGTVLTLTGLVVCENRIRFLRRKNNE